MPLFLKTALYYGAWVTAFLGISYAIGLITQENMAWYDTLNKPLLTPSDIIFPIMWTALYILLAICGGIVARAPQKLLFALFAAYMIVNWAWSFIFFGAQMISVGFYWIILSNMILLTFIIMARKNQTACALLALPTFLWGCFAAYLNGMIMILN